jgi:hypothetical protein
MIELNLPQSEFINTKEPFRGYVGGYRAGKTFVGCVRLWMLAAGYPDIKLGYFAPTYPHIRDIFYSTIEEVAELFCDHAGMSCAVEINKSEHTVKLLMGGVQRATVKCRSMEHPYRIVGFDISHALIDEIDIMPITKADLAWKKIIARMSSVRDDYEVNTVDFTTTPEGFNWMYKFFVSELDAKPEMKRYYKLVKASTLQNRKNLPADYIDKLYSTYPPNLVEAYVNGEFVNLTSGSVYNQYDRTLNNTSRTWDGREELHIGMDFNIGKMAAIVHVIDGNKPRAVDEISNAYDTTEIIEIIKDRYRGAQISVYPDSSGKNRDTASASKTDISLLEQAGFKLYYDSRNPFIRDRVIAMNKQFCDNDGYRNYLINTDKCPEYAKCLEQQVYGKEGKPDKSQGKDHMNDAGGYFIYNRYPVVKPNQDINIGFGI